MTSGCLSPPSNSGSGFSYSGGGSGGCACTGRGAADADDAPPPSGGDAAAVNRSSGNTYTSCCPSSEASTWPPKWARTGSMWPPHSRRASARDASSLPLRRLGRSSRDSQCCGPPGAPASFRSRKSSQKGATCSASTHPLRKNRGGEMRS